jgi:hypothetical protein
MALRESGRLRTEGTRRTAHGGKEQHPREASPEDGLPCARNQYTHPHPVRQDTGRLAPNGMERHIACQSTRQRIWRPVDFLLPSFPLYVSGQENRCPRPLAQIN